MGYSFQGEGGGGLQLLHKKQTQTWNIYWQKKFIKNFFFSVIIKNLNWEILTKNLVTFKRWDGIKAEKL